jgi:hypothetical protein
LNKKVDITLTASAVKQKTYKATLSVDGTKAETGSLFHQLAAKGLIKEFEEKRSCFHTNETNLVKGKTQEDVNKEIIRLSTR